MYIYLLLSFMFCVLSPSLCPRDFYLYSFYCHGDWCTESDQNSALWFDLKLSEIAHAVL